MKRLLLVLTLVAAAAFAGGITGQVVDAGTGRPIAGALVVAKSPNDAGQARTNERGIYRIADLEPGSYDVGATARGFAGARFPRPVPVRANQITEDVDFRLARKRPEAGAISGRVVHARSREPIAGAVVVAKGENGAGRAVTDRRGFYKMKLRPGAYRLAAKARGYTPESYPEPVPVRPGRVTKDVNFALRPSKAALAD